MADSLANAQREVNAIGRAQRRIVAARVEPPAAAESHQGLALALGARVLDLVDGVEGRIVAGAAQHIISAPGAAARVESYTVALADGQTVTRQAHELAVLPADLRTDLLAGAEG